MLRTRLWMGALLAFAVLGVLVVDRQLTPWFPFLLATLLIVEVVASVELLGLLGPSRRLPAWFCCAAVALLILANWPAYILAALWHIHTDPWHWVVGTFTAVVVSAFLVEMATFREPGESVTRVAVTVWLAAYLGLLPAFFAQLRWPALAAFFEGDGAYHGSLALALAVFVPKCGDIGAYVAGHLFGKHKMTPVLSPKKTWEGFAGGLAASVAVAELLYRLDSNLCGAPFDAAGFGVTVWIASVLGDLAESLIKRDCRQKDASQAVPGFGGLLDVIDSVLFAAPVAYCWLR